jgi:ABC-2 type transport system ATP-binding protein
LEYVVEGRGIEKSFAKKKSTRELLRHPFRRAERVDALRGVDLKVRSGEIFGLLGPNGAGKTTLVKIFSCLVIPDAGSARVFGVDTRKESQVKPKIGLVNTDERSFYWRLSGRENLRFFSAIYDVPRRRAAAKISELLERVDMTEAADRRFADYSAGMKQRLSIARSLLHDPPLLLMDEPTRSLDPAASHKLRRFITEELCDRDGKTILIATHNLAEAEEICHRVAIVVKGRIRETGPVESVRRFGLEQARYRISMRGGPDELPGPFVIEEQEHLDGLRRLQIRLQPGAGLHEVMYAWMEAGVTIVDCDHLEANLEAAFRRVLDAGDSE